MTSLCADCPISHLLFRCSKSDYYHAGVVIITIDLHEPDIFEHCDRWLKDAGTKAEKNSFLVAVGCKTGASRAVSKEEMEKFFSQRSVPYVEVSLISGEGVKELFQFALKSYLTKFHLL